MPQKTARSKKDKKATRRSAATDSAADVSTAEEQLHAAREAMRQAEENWRQARAATDASDADNPSLGPWVEHTLELVRRYPTAGVACAALVGFYVGRLFGR